MSRILGVAVAACLVASTARADRPILALHQVHLDRTAAPSVINSHVLFLNRCKNGCTLTYGTTDSRSDHSDIGHGMLTPYSYGDTQWGKMVACVKQIMAPFNIQVTDVDPGTADHFEVMVAGSPQELGLSGGVGGIADYACTAPGQCNSYIPDALVFDFSDVWGDQYLDDCATVAQEIAHTWSLDHVAVASDPMTYFPYSGMRTYQDHVQCGSDCFNGQSPFGLPCNGQYHTCMSTGTAYQDDVQTIKKLFGPAGAVAPTLKITSPTDGSGEQSGTSFEVDVSCTSGDGIQEVDMSIDGVPKFSLTQSPYKFMTPANLPDGAHKIDILCATNNQATSTASVQVVVGQNCNGDSDCPMNDICYEHACIPGPNATGGLGATCANNTDCTSGVCANDGTKSACVIGCDLNNDQCPSGFGCEQAGTSGVCWPGAAHGGGGGGCDAGSGSPGGLIALGFGVALVLGVRRRKAGAA